MKHSEFRRMRIEGPCHGIADRCERVLRTLPRWFRLESALMEYAADVEHHPTFAAFDRDRLVGFLTLREHFPTSWEVHCLAVEAPCRGRGIGRFLHAHAEQWLAARGALLLQVKTMAAAHPSPEHEQTRRFYARIGYIPLETFPELRGPRQPVLQLVKKLGGDSPGGIQMG